MASFSALSSLAPPASSFVAKKTKILQQLGVGDQDYTDLSPKGSVDLGIRDVIGELNGIEGLVTTSSCAGRISVFLEGRRDTASAVTEVTGDNGSHIGAAQEENGELLEGGNEQSLSEMRGQAQMQTQAGVGGKGGGGTWLFVSHDPVELKGMEDDSLLSLFGLTEKGLEGNVLRGTEGTLKTRRLVHFKFEPMILHVLTASTSHAQLLLKCALQSGFRESGALNITPPQPSQQSQSPELENTVTPMVAVRTNGLALESLIGINIDFEASATPLVSIEYLRMLLDIGNERFIENARRIARFRDELKKAITGGPERGELNRKAKKKAAESGAEWEDAAARRERKREEGLRRKAEMDAAGERRGQDAHSVDDLMIGGDDDGNANDMTER